MTRRGPADRPAAPAHRRRARARGDARRPARPLRPGGARREAWDNVPLPIGAGQTISQPLVVARMCELLAAARATSGSSTSAPARATTRRCWPGWARTCGASSATPRCPSRRRATCGGGHPQRHARRRRRRAAACRRRAPFDAINVAAAAGDDIPPALEEQLAHRAGGSSSRSSTATSACRRPAHAATGSSARASSACASSRSSADLPNARGLEARVRAELARRPSRTACRRSSRRRR